MRIWTQEEINDVMARRENKETLQQIGNIYGVSRERIRQVQAKALRKIRREKESKIGNNVLEWKIDSLEVSGRLNRCLWIVVGDGKVKDILNYSPSELLRYPNFGRVSLAELQKVLMHHGLSLKQS